MENKSALSLLRELLGQSYFLKEADLKANFKTLILPLKMQQGNLAEFLYI